MEMQINAFNEHYTDNICQKQKDINKKQQLKATNKNQRPAFRNSFPTSYLSSMGKYTLSLPNSYVPFCVSKTNQLLAQNPIQDALPFMPVTKCAMDPSTSFQPVSLPMPISYSYGYTDYYSPMLTVQPPSLSSSPVHFAYDPPIYPVSSTISMDENTKNTESMCSNDQKENITHDYTNTVPLGYAKENFVEKTKEEKNMTELLDEQMQLLLN